MVYRCDFDDLSDTLLRVNAAAEAAEAQGLLCGLICVKGRVDRQSWKSQVLGADLTQADLLIQEANQQLDTLYEETHESLYDEELGFDLFMPLDDVSMQERIAALGEWCQGFLLGYSEQKMDNMNEDLRQEIDELLNDFVEITRIQPDDEAEDDEEEGSLMEVQEYIRMAVMYIFSSLHPLPTGGRLQ
jgi:yecA family protein